jgi:phage gpG-like protein
MNETREYFAMLDRVAAAANKLPRRAATEAVNFSKERFRKQNWVDYTTQPWKPRKPAWQKQSKRRGQRAILIDTGRLRRSIRVVHVDSHRAVIGTDVPWARVHNEGFRGQVKQNIAAHTRSGGVTRKSHRVKSHTRTINQHIPQRQFIGASAVLQARLVRLGVSEINKAIKG